jgi:hypothetical protein
LPEATIRNFDRLAVPLKSSQKIPGSEPVHPGSLAELGRRDANRLQQHPARDVLNLTLSLLRHCDV